MVCKVVQNIRLSKLKPVQFVLTPQNIHFEVRKPGGSLKNKLSKDMSIVSVAQVVIKIRWKTCR